MAAEYIAPETLPPWVALIRPRTEAEAATVRREVEHLRAVVTITYSERLPLATVGEVVKRNAYREHMAIGGALWSLSASGLDMTAEGLQ